MAISTPGSNEFPGGRALPDETFDDGLLDDDDEEEAEGETDMSGFSPEESFLESARKKRLILDDQTDEEDVEDGVPVRRSRRATRGVRLAFWKNERPLYKRGQFVGLEPVKPTPKKITKPRKRLIKNSDQTSRSNRAMGSWRNDDDEEEEDETGAAAPVRLPDDRDFLDRDSVTACNVWDDFTGAAIEANVFCTQDSLYPPTSLAVSGMYKCSISSYVSLHILLGKYFIFIFLCLYSLTPSWK